MRKLLPVILLVAVISGVVGYRMYNKSHTETKDAKSDVVISPKALLEIYEMDETAADAKYLDKIIEVKGVVKEISAVATGGSLTLEGINELSSIICEFESQNAYANIKIGEEVTVKGFCTGYLMGNVVLSRCSLDN